MDPKVVDYDPIANESEIFVQEKSKEEKVEEFGITLVPCQKMKRTWD